MIVVGDFNLVIDPAKDYYNYLHVNNPKAREAVLDQMNICNLADVYRDFHPDQKRYTWRKTHPLKQARLDFILISQSLVQKVQNCDILSSYKSDHSPVLLNLKCNDFKHGKGLWKFNNSLLKQQKYLDTINEVIKNIKKSTL